MRSAFLLIVVVAAGLSLLGVHAWRTAEAPSAAAYGSSVVEALSATKGTEGFAKARVPRPFVFPRDAGPHPGFQTEWWYYTGNLDSSDGRHYGYQLTFFRRALTSRPAPRTSAWGASQVYFAHFAVTDAGGGRFHSDERWSRGAAGLAGVTPASRGGGAAFDAWVESWSARSEDGRVRLRAAGDDAAIDLVLEPRREAVLQGDHGLSHKSVDPTNASYYYSIPRIETHGTIEAGGHTVEVRGESWLDREWSTSALSRDEVGWDWFSLQLSDGREIMLYHMRRRDGGLDPNSSGTLMWAGGERCLRLSDVALETLGTWTSPTSGGVYPARWRLRIPAEGLDLEIAPWLADQEQRGAFRYWEGAVKVRSADGRVTGNGYVELTGYADRPPEP